MSDSTRRRRLSDIRDRMNAQFNRLLNEDGPEEGSSLLQRFEMFRQQEGAGPVRRQRSGRSRRLQQITFRVSVLRSNALTHYRSHRDATPACRVVVPWDLDAQGFRQALRDNIPELPVEFELCRVSGQRRVIQLEEQCPREIQRRNSLGRSALYLRPVSSDSNPLNDPEVLQPQVPSNHTGVERSQADELQQPQVPSNHTGVERSQADELQQPQVPREDFYVDSEESDGEEVFLASPVRVDPDENMDLSTILNDFRQGNIDMSNSVTIIARRRHVLQSACMALSRAYFDWHKVPNIEFLTEMAEDYGGPRREFFRLLMIEIHSSLGVFEGRPGDLMFTYNQQSLAQKKYYTAGKLIAWSIMHNGPGPRSINSEVFQMMCGERPDLTSINVDLFLDVDITQKIEKVVRCSTTQDLASLKDALADWIADCGVPDIYTATLQDLPRIKEQIVAHFLFHRVSSMTQQFIAGMDACGNFWQVVKRFWRQFLPVFTNTGVKLSRNCVQNLFTVAWSPAGSNKRDQEEATMYQWEWWLMGIQEGEVDSTFEELLVFVTGADSLPPLGFSTDCTIEFYEQEPGTRRIPFASTCSLCLSLPRGVGDEGEFKDLMQMALKGSLGFGKV